MANQRPDFNGSNYDDTFIGDLVNFVASNSFQSMFESYFLTHALKFSDDEEHKLEYYEMFQEFHKLFEDQLQIFCDEKGISQEEFMARCGDAQTEDPKAQHYISILLSSVEYKTFVTLMKIMRPVAERKQRMAAAVTAQADSKDEGSDEPVQTDVKGGADDNLPDFKIESDSKAGRDEDMDGKDIGDKEVADSKGGDFEIEGDDKKIEYDEKDASDFK